MSTTGRTTEHAPAGALAAAVRDAGFVRIAARPDGDALAATGLLARACSDAGVPFQASVAATDRELADQLDVAGLPVAVGATPPGDGHGLAADGRPASTVAARVARELGADPDPVLALAGVVAAGATPGEDLLGPARESGAVERRPGLAVPTDDVADGLAHSTLVHGPFSARPDAAAGLVDDALGDEDDAGRRRLASLVAVETAGAERATDRSAAAVERALRPLATPDGPFATVGGYADVLAALAHERPGAGIALALGGAGREAALSAWRDHARAAHEGLRAATTGRYDGLLVARVEDAPVATTARLLADFAAPEPVGLVVSDGEAAVVARPDAAVPTDPLRDAAAALDGAAGPLARGGYARFEGGADEFVERYREAV